MLLTSLNFDQNQRIFLNEAQNSGCLLKKTEILSEAQKNGKNENKNGKTNHCIYSDDANNRPSLITDPPRAFSKMS